MVAVQRSIDTPDQLVTSHHWLADQFANGVPAEFCSASALAILVREFDERWTAEAAEDPLTDVSLTIREAIELTLGSLLERRQTDFCAADERNVLGNLGFFVLRFPDIVDELNADGFAADIGEEIDAFFEEHAGQPGASELEASCRELVPQLQA